MITDGDMSLAQIIDRQWHCPLPVARCPLPVARCPLPVAQGIT